MGQNIYKTNTYNRILEVYSHSTFSPMVRIAICQELLGVGGNVINFYVEVIPIMMLLEKD